MRSRIPRIVARKHGKPVLHISRHGSASSPQEELCRFILENNIQVLNVAGPRASKEADVAAFVRQVLEKAFA